MDTEIKLNQTNDIIQVVDISRIEAIIMAYHINGVLSKAGLWVNGKVIDITSLLVDII